jgi:2-methylaconitate isomerase
MQRPIPAVFMRGGTSKAIMFHARDLPPDRAAWDPIFAAAMGSPDPYGRQLDGMGGGVSSLSKVCVLAPSARDDADIDYTFAQVQIKEKAVDYKGNCGNMSSAVGPFAVDEGLVGVDADTATVRIFNTNTAKIIHSTFPLHEGRARYDGDLVIPGVFGTGAPIRLDFVEPGGATTGKLLPSGATIDRLEVPGFGPVDASLVDAANATVFVRARDIGLTGVELPEQLEAKPEILKLLDNIRVAGSVRMGIAPDIDAARAVKVVPCRVRQSARGGPHARGRYRSGSRHRPVRTHHFKWPAASGAAVDSLALHRRCRGHRRHGRCRSIVAFGRQRIGPPRDALGCADCRR